MQKLIDLFTDYNFWISFISVFLTILALAYTLYYWLLDHVNGDETTFISNKEALLTDIRDCLDTMKDNPEPEKALPGMEHLTAEIELLLNYRFWGYNKRAAEYRRINTFYQDSRYLLSSLRRSLETKEAGAKEASLVAVDRLSDGEWTEICADYRKGLWYLAEFVENW